MLEVLNYSGDKDVYLWVRVCVCVCAEGGVGVEGLLPWLTCEFLLHNCCKHPLLLLQQTLCPTTME